jgi:hypothetical protein
MRIGLQLRVALPLSARDIARVLSTDETWSRTKSYAAVSGDGLAGPARASIFHQPISPMWRNRIDGVLLLARRDRCEKKSGVFRVLSSPPQCSSRRRYREAVAGAEGGRAEEVSGGRGREGGLLDSG